MTELYSQLLRSITTWQYELNRLVATNLRSLDSNEAWLAIGTILGISFIYGVIHAMGPGHGKALVGFYFLKKGGSYKRAFKIGYMLSITHAVSALSLTLVIFYLLKTLFSKTFHDYGHMSMLLSAVLIIGVGVYLIYETYRHKKNQENECYPTTEKKSDLAIAISAGIVPCPGVMTITLFAINLGHLSVGIASAIVMSIGMGLTISLAGIFSVAVQKRGYNALGKYGFLLEFFSALLVIVLGIFLLLANLEHAKVI